MTVGLMLSNTFTIAVAESLIPLTSVTINLTGFAPMLLQLKSYLLRVFVAIAQLSLEPLSI